jgi:TonB-dependent starch-binding outer membrane protein SusC
MNAQLKMYNIFRFNSVGYSNTILNALNEGDLRIFLLFFLLLIKLTSSAQQKAVTGIITDTESRKPLRGSNITVKGSGRGVVTNIDGLFSLVASEGETLVFSKTGFTPQEFIIGRETLLEIRLIQQDTGLDEMAEVGYARINRKDATGALGAIASDDFNVGAIISPQKLITGKISGVNITSKGGSPGDEVSVLIRGASSLLSENNPLIVLNGMPLATDGILGMKNPLNTIHPYDIESITVLKDASATAIYGSRGSNGVILITSKKGSMGAPLKFTYNGYMTLGSRSRKIWPLTADAFRTILQEQYPDEPDALNLQGYGNTDWQGEIYRTSVGYDHNLSAAGNIRNFPFRASIGYTNQQGILDTDGMNRLTSSLTINSFFLERQLKLNLNINNMVINNQFGNRRAISSAFAFDPTQPVKNESPFAGYFAWTHEDGSPKIHAEMNPVALLKLHDEHSNVMRSLGNVEMDYRIHFLPHFRANLNLGYDVSAGNGSVLVPEFAPWHVNVPGREGNNSRFTQDKRNTLVEFYLNYAKISGTLNSQLDAIAGYSLQHFWKAGIYQSSIFRETEEIIYTRYENESYITSLFGRLNYRYKERYIATFSLRQDGLSKHQTFSHRDIFPAVAFAWLISGEPFLPETRILSELKLRTGVGITGQPNMDENEYPYIPQYTVGDNIVPYYYDNALHRFHLLKGYNTSLNREKTIGYNIGLDYGFLDNRISGSLDAYYRFTDNLVNYIPVSHGTNLISRIVTNEGSMENRGIEFNAEIIPLLRQDKRWDVGFNFSINKNKIIRLTEFYHPGYSGIETGAISGGIGNTVQLNQAGHPAGSFFVFEQVYDNTGKPLEGVYADRNGDGRITAEDRYLYKKAAPDVMMGIYSAFKYQNWDFRLNGRISINNYIYNNVWSWHGTFSNLYHPTGYLNNMSRNVFDTHFRDAQYLSDYYIRNASFMRIDNISAGYTFPKLHGGALQMRVYGTVQNVVVLTGYKGTDPEISNGIDTHFYPRPRTFLAGVTLHY